jgi:drug/metabolite transporter (DMT)-like permease
MNKKKLSYLMLMLCNLFWAGNYIVGKNLVGLIDPIWITYLRWLFASLILLVISRIIEKPSLKSIKNNIVPLILMGLLGNLGYNLILYTALNHTSSLNASIINSLNPGLLVIISFLILKEEINIQKIIGISISLIGVLIVITESNLSLLMNFSFNRGDILMLLAITMWSLYSIVSKKLVEIKPITATAYSALIATGFMIPLALLNGNPPRELSGILIVSMLYIIIFPSVGSFLFWNFSIKNIEVGIAGISINLIPVFIALISWGMGKSISSSQIIGGLVVFIGVLITSNLISLRGNRDISTK